MPGLEATEKFRPIQASARSIESLAFCGLQHWMCSPSTFASPSSSLSSAMITEAMPAQVMLPVPGTPSRYPHEPSGFCVFCK